MRTEKEIQDEITALQKELKALKPGKPVRLPIKDMDIEKLITLVDSCIEFIWSPEENPDRDRLEGSNFKDWIYEAAVEMVYGKKIWDTIRELQK